MLLPTDTGARTRGDLLLTGSTGFLGMELLARLLEDTDRRVWAPVRAGDDAEAEARLRATLATLLPDPGTYSERVVAFAADLTQPRLGLGDRRREEIAEHVWRDHPLGRIRVVHAAARGGARRSTSREPAGCSSSPPTARAGGLTRFAHVSTAYVAGDHSGDFAETRPRPGPGLQQHLRAVEVGGRAARSASAALGAAGADLPAEHRRRPRTQRLDRLLQRHLHAAADVRARVRCR